MSDPSVERYKVEESVLGFSGNMLYEAKVIDVRDSEDPKKAMYKVHYQGWKTRYDEYVPAHRLRKDTKENREEMERMSDANRQQRKSQKRTERLAGNKRALDALGAPAKVPKLDEKRLMTIDLPEALKMRLLHEWNWITKEKRLVPVPREPSVAAVLARYLKSPIARTKPEEGKVLSPDLVNVILEYFDKALGSLLLYKFERPQYDRLLKEKRGIRMRDLYGAEHLLRLIVKLPSLCAISEADEGALDELIDEVKLIAKFLQTEMDVCFLGSYANSTAQYQRTALT